MTVEPRLDIIGAALGDPSRSRILCELMDGRAFTNKELASAAKISPQTASTHLRRLEATGLTSSLHSGRHVYHRIANVAVARTLEKLAHLSPTDHLSRAGKAGDETCKVRSCYDHIAGRVGVLMTDHLCAFDVLRDETEMMLPGAKYQDFINDIGVEVPATGQSKPVAKPCLDWTERRPHISGPLAIGIMRRFLDAHWLERRTGSRILTVTDAGYNALDRWFGLSRQALDDPNYRHRFDR